MFAVCMLSETRILSKKIASDIQQLLQDFRDIFQESKQIPSVREIDHHINLKEGTESISVRPYKYAFFFLKEKKKSF